MAFAPSSSRAFTKRSIGGAWRAAGNPTAASLTTALTGTNNDLVFTAKQGGLRGNNLRVAYVVSGNNRTLAVSYDHTRRLVTVTVATDGSGVATSRASDIATRVNSTASIPVAARNAASNDGTGVVTAMSATSLTGGTLWRIGTSR